jgi:Mlc titration factor MtfA (ptsG expression regulator)
MPTIAVIIDRRSPSLLECDRDRDRKLRNKALKFLTQKVAIATFELNLVIPKYVE